MTRICGSHFAPKGLQQHGSDHTRTQNSFSGCTVLLSNKSRCYQHQSLPRCILVQVSARTAVSEKKQQIKCKHQIMPVALEMRRVCLLHGRRFSPSWAPWQRAWRPWGPSSCPSSSAQARALRRRPGTPCWAAAPCPPRARSPAGVTAPMSAPFVKRPAGCTSMSIAYRSPAGATMSLSRVTPSQCLSSAPCIPDGNPYSTSVTCGSSQVFQHVSEATPAAWTLACM